MDKYADVLAGKGTQQQCNDTCYQCLNNVDSKIAAYFESHGEFQEAGKFYKMCTQYQKAMKLFLRCGEGAIMDAIEVVCRNFFLRENL